MNTFIGIDTSCYTSSVAAADENENLLMSIRKMLTVEEGARGLRQSDGVFQHLKNLPDIFSPLRNDIKGVKAVAASVKPRPASNSYMPVFVVSGNIGQVVADVLQAKFIPATHQHAHIYAAMIGNHLPDVFIAVHVSGGTLELLKVQKQDGIIQSIALCGATADITAGQLIDRVGVKMGLAFPCGGEMETLAKNGGQKELRLPVTVKGTAANLSGAEAVAYRALQSGIAPESVSYSVFMCVAETLSRLIANTCEKEGIAFVLLMGGVCSSELIDQYIVEELYKKEIKASVAKREYAADNAAGLAIMAKRIYDSEGL